MSLMCQRPRATVCGLSRQPFRRTTSESVYRYEIGQGGAGCYAGHADADATGLRDRYGNADADRADWRVRDGVDRGRLSPVHGGAGSAASDSGLQVTQTGQLGGTTGLSIRGGSTNANKVLIDDVPVNDIGGAVEFANFATVGIQQIEVLREPNSALYGSDALAGVVSMTTTRGTTRLPLFTYAGDGGNFSTYHEEATASGVARQFDYYGAFGRLDSGNNLPNDSFHNATYVGNFGWDPNPANDLRFTVRHLSVSGGQPNAILLYGIPDDAAQKAQNTYYSGAWNNQATAKWHNEIRYGGLRLQFAVRRLCSDRHSRPRRIGQLSRRTRSRLTERMGTASRARRSFNSPETYPNQFVTITNRDFVYAQTDYRINPHIVALGGFKYEAERGSTQFTGSPASNVSRGNYSYTLQISGDIRNRLLLQRRQRHRGQRALRIGRDAARLARLLSCSAFGDRLAERNETARQLRQGDQGADRIAASQFRLRYSFGPAERKPAYRAVSCWTDWSGGVTHLRWRRRSGVVERSCAGWCDLLPQ